MSVDIYKIANEVMDVLEMHDHKPSRREIESDVKYWASQKASLIDLLRKHPQWSEEHLAVLWDYDTEREIDAQAFNNSIDKLMLVTSILNSNDDYWKIFENIRKLPLTKFIQSEGCEILKDYGVVEGQKTARALRKIFVDSGIAKTFDELVAANGYAFRPFEAQMTIIADALSPLAITRHTLISVHPCDYLHMTYGFNSCHNIDSGCYMAGTLSYMNDKTTMIFYTVDRSFDGNSPYYMQDKINREVFAYGHGVLLQSRLYPNNNDTLNKDNFRNAVQKVIADCEGVSNSWKLFRSQSEVNRYVETGGRSLHYPDYTYSTYNANVSLLKPVVGCDNYDSVAPITVGNTAYCICCGEELDDASSLVCEDCSDYVRCEQCGDLVAREDAYQDDDGYWYCSDCVRFCDDCDEVIFPYQDKYAVGGDGWVCSHCYENNYGTCEFCSNTYINDELHEIDGHTYCSDCLEEMCAPCSRCGEIHDTDNMTELDNGDYICEYCENELNEENSVKEAV